MNYIGVDLGTSSVKIILMDESGKVKNSVTKEYPLSFPNPGWSEQSPMEWYDKTIEGIKELLLHQDTQIAGIGVGGQMHGLVVLDEKDDVIRPAILWNDGRTTEENNYLNQVIGEEKLAEYTSNISFTGFTAPKILWVEKHEPENFSKIKKIMLPKDYLVYRLSGAFSTDVSDASGMLLLDVKNRCWSKEMLDICHIREEQLPKLYESYEAVGSLKNDIVSELGITPCGGQNKDEVLVVAGAGDNAAAAVATGTVYDGACNLSVGTSGTVFIATKDYKATTNHAIHNFCDSTGAYHYMGCMLSAASCNLWWMQDVLGTKDFAKEQADIKEENLGENSVYYLPYLMGERSPHNDEKIRGAFLGLSMDTTRADMTQAMLEGVAFGLKDSLEVARDLGIKVETSKICGGGVKSPLWQKIIANVLNVKLEILVSEEGPSLGGAIMAAVANGSYASVEDACKQIIKIDHEVVPDATLVKKYDKKYETYKKFYPALKGI
ncbi:MAG: xylulokinase [Lachnospiraceae bacterium]|nr:xylulokinase [Lachnospiraceae bacterium]